MGLTNPGATHCYQIAAVQALNSIREVVDHGRSVGLEGRVSIPANASAEVSGRGWDGGGGRLMEGGYERQGAAIVQGTTSPVLTTVLQPDT